MICVYCNKHRTRNPYCCWRFYHADHPLLVNRYGTLIPLEPDEDL